MPISSPHIRVVASFEELVSTRFAGEINALCWPRALPGDFQEIIDKLQGDAGITSIDDDDLRRLEVTSAGAAARAVLLADLAMMRDHALEPALDCIRGYSRDTTAAPITTDVYSFHVDRAPVEADTWLCTYAGASSEGLANADAVRRVDDAGTRTRLLADFGGHDDAEFDAWLAANSYDLHYAQRAGAEPYAFGVGNLWRIAIAWPGNPVQPCIHRAPPMPPGATARLLLIS